MLRSQRFTTVDARCNTMSAAVAASTHGAQRCDGAGRGPVYGVMVGANAVPPA